MYYNGPAGYPQPGGRGQPMGYPQGGAGMPRPRFYAPPGGMPGMPPMAAYPQQQQQQFNQYAQQQQQQQPPAGPRGGAPRPNLPPSQQQQQIPSGARPLGPNGGAPLPPNGVPRAPVMPGQQPQAPRGVPAGPSAARAGYKGTRAEETTNGSGLTAAVLANAAPQEQKQMLGEAYVIYHLLLHSLPCPTFRFPSSCLAHHLLRFWWCIKYAYFVCFSLATQPLPQDSRFAARSRR